MRRCNKMRNCTVAFASSMLLLVCTVIVDTTLQQSIAIAAQSAVPIAMDPGSFSQPFIASAKQAKASVVNISSIKKSQQRNEPGSNPFFDDPLFRRFFGDEFERRVPVPREYRERSLGSGVIVTSDGYIVTNNHVVEESDEVTVSLPDKRIFKAKIVGTDPKTDVALIKIDASNLPTVPWGDAGQLQVGEMVLAVGNPFGLMQTVTMGIISAIGRANMGIVDYEDFIQTDAAINPGNSGGALVNLKGELIGIPSAIFSGTGGNMGIGFAVPSTMVKSVVSSLLKHGKVVRGWMGISIQEVTPDLAKEFGSIDTQGALVADVMEESPAAKARLERGDIITAFNGIAIRDPGQLRMLVAETPPGKKATLSVVRNKNSQDIHVTIAELPKDLTTTSRRDESPSGKGEHALIGITVENLTNQSDGLGRSKQSGVVVTEVEPDSPAERGGVRTGDVIREINRKPIKDVRDFERLTNQLSPHASVLLLLNRGKATLFLSITTER